MRRVQGTGTCEHLFLAGNCPYCLIVRLRQRLADVEAECERLEARIAAVRVLHRAAAAERDEQRARAERERRYRVALERHVERERRLEVRR